MVPSLPPVEPPPLVPPNAKSGFGAKEALFIPKMVPPLTFLCDLGTLDFGDPISLSLGSLPVPAPLSTAAAAVVGILEFRVVLTPPPY